MDECPFCARVDAGKCTTLPYGVVMFEPLHPVTPGHMLFVPRLHTISAVETPELAGHTVAAAARYAVGSQCNLITSSGTAATQTVFHLHVHYVPRRYGDGLTLPWTPPGDPYQRGYTAGHDHLWRDDAAREELDGWQRGFVQALNDNHQGGPESEQ